MKVTVRGNGNEPVTSEQVKHVIDMLNRDYQGLGVKVKGVTMYVRFEDKDGTTVDVREGGSPVNRTVTFDDDGNGKEYGRTFRKHAVVCE